METIDPFQVLHKVAEQMDSEDKEWMQQRLQFIIFSLNHESKYVDLTEHEDDDEDDD